MSEDIGGQIIGYGLSKLGTQTFQAYDPQKQQVLSNYFTDATAEEVDMAVRKAAEAFNLYKKMPGTEKAAFLEAIAARIEALGEELIEVAAQETGLTYTRLRNERGRTTSQLRLFASLLEEGSWVQARIDKAEPENQLPDLRQIQIPLGVVGVFGASNFPLAFSVAGGDTASALAAGCPVVFKAHPAHPHTSFLAGYAIRDAAKAMGLPEGVFSLLQGSSHDVGMSLVQHPGVAAIGFTGSFRGGKALYDAAVRRPRPIPVYAEMGSVNPVFLLPRALEERTEQIAQGLLGSVSLGTGQFCTNPGIFTSIEDSGSKELILLLKEKLGSVGPCAMLSPAIHAAYTAGVRRLIEEYKLQKLAEGEPESEGRACIQLLQTDVESALQHPEITEEVFGPSSIHIKAGSPEDLYRLASSLEGQLTVSLHGTAEDFTEFGKLVDILREKAGRLIINGYPTGVAVRPAMVHGGPFPATTFPNTTSVGTAAIYRFTRPVCYQDFPQELLPEELKNSNPLKIWRLVNGEFTANQLS